MKWVGFVPSCVYTLMFGIVGTLVDKYRQHMCEPPDPRILLALKEVAHVLEEEGIDYFLDYGTALDAVRDGKIHKYERDADIGVWVEDHGKIMKVLRDKLPSHYFMYQDKYYVTGNDIASCPVEKVHYDAWSWCDFREVNYPGYFKVDLTFYFRDNATQQILNQQCARPWQSINGAFAPKPFDVVLPLSVATLEGHQFRAPRNGVKFSTMNYGCIGHIGVDCMIDWEMSLKQLQLYGTRYKPIGPLTAADEDAKDAMIKMEEQDLIPFC